MLFETRISSVRPVYPSTPLNGAKIFPLFNLIKISPFLTKSFNFKSCLENINEKNIVFSCGSGVTACVLALAYSLINDKYHPCIYDGSWAEYGII